MTRVVISPHNVINFPEGGGHFWAYMQYAMGLRQLGCQVYWLEGFRSSGDESRDASRIARFAHQLAHFDLGGELILYKSRDPSDGVNGVPLEYIEVGISEAETIFRQADLLLNFNYRINPDLLACFKHTAVVDIDPGLLQFWLSTDQIDLPAHDTYFTIGETVGTPSALFPDCGLSWNHIRPPVCLDLWNHADNSSGEAFTTVSSWWGDEWITDGKSVYENNKRVSFMEFAELARKTNQLLELAIYFGEGDTDDLRVLENNGWRIRHSKDVTQTPQMYRSYIFGSRGEFSCAKPSCMKFQNAWVSDRTLCYLASGKPAVVQNTGPSTFLPDGEGLLRFSTLDEAADAIETVNMDYAKHCRAARGVAETYFDARQSLETILNCALR
jgi:hypothetical protein